jgi:hypothetical protein
VLCLPDKGSRFKEEVMYGYQLEALAAERARELRAEAAKVGRVLEARRAAARRRAETETSSPARAADPNAVIARLDVAPDSYGEFVTRAEGWLREEPSALERSRGRAAS